MIQFPNISIDEGALSSIYGNWGDVVMIIAEIQFGCEKCEWIQEKTASEKERKSENKVKKCKGKKKGLFTCLYACDTYNRIVRVQ